MVTLMFITKKGRPSTSERSERALASVLFGQYGERGFSPLFRCFVSILRATCGGQNTLGKILKPQILTPIRLACEADRVSRKSELY